MGERFKKIYKKHGVHCEDYCDEIEAKKQNKAFKKMKLEDGAYGLFNANAKTTGIDKCEDIKKNEITMEMFMRGEKSKKGIRKTSEIDKNNIIGSILLIVLIIFIVLYISIAI